MAIVTGGSRGLGREVARTLAGRGYAVVLYYARNQRAAEAAVDQVLAANGAALSVRGDVADELDVERLFTETIEAFGKIDVVVHAVRTVHPSARMPIVTSTSSIRCCRHTFAAPSSSTGRRRVSFVTGA